MKRLCIQLLWGLVALLLASATTFAAPDTDKPSSRQSRASAKKEKSGKPAYGEGLLDINTAEAGQLKTLPGLSDEDVKKIIAGRPYTPTTVVSKVSDQLANANIDVASIVRIVTSLAAA